MKWLYKWVYHLIKKAATYEQEQQKQEAERDYQESRNLKMSLAGAQMVAERGRPEGEDRISFELSTAVGGKILNVRRYDARTDRQETTTYVVPNGEDLAERVVKILQLETFK